MTTVPPKLAMSLSHALVRIEGRISSQAENYGMDNSAAVAEEQSEAL